MSTYIGIGATGTASDAAFNRKPRPRARARACWDFCDADCSMCWRYDAMTSNGGRDSPELESVLYRL